MLNNSDMVECAKIDRLHPAHVVCLFQAAHLLYFQQSWHSEKEGEKQGKSQKERYTYSICKPLKMRDSVAVSLILSERWAKVEQSEFKKWKKRKKVRVSVSPKLITMPNVGKSQSREYVNHLRRLRTQYKWTAPVHSFLNEPWKKKRKVRSVEVLKQLLFLLLGENKVQLKNIINHATNPQIPKSHTLVIVWTNLILDLLFIYLLFKQQKTWKNCGLILLRITSCLFFLSTFLCSLTTVIGSAIPWIHSSLQDKSPLESKGETAAGGKAIQL